MKGNELERRQSHQQLAVHEPVPLWWAAPDSHLPAWRMTVVQPRFDAQEPQEYVRVEHHNLASTLALFSLALAVALGCIWFGSLVDRAGRLPWQKECEIPAWTPPKSNSTPYVTADP